MNKICCSAGRGSSGPWTCRWEFRVKRMQGIRAGLTSQPCPNHSPQQTAPPLATTLDFVQTSSKADLVEEAGGGHLPGLGCGRSAESPTPLRLRPASAPPLGLFISLVRGPAEKARVPPTPGPGTSVPCAPAESLTPLPARPLPRPAPPRPSQPCRHGALVLAVGRCLAARGGPSAAAAAARRPTFGPPVAGCTGAAGCARLAVPAPAARTGRTRRSGCHRLDHVVPPGAPATPACGHSRGAHHR